MFTYELLLKGGAVARWNGGDGEAAARNYVAEHPDATVIAWRKPRYPVTVLGRGKVTP